MSSNRTIAAVVLTTVALSVGTVGVASASQSKSNAKAVSVRQTTTRTTVNAVANPMAGPMGQKGNQGAELANVLITLVRAGTITQGQSDAITAALNTARLAHEANEANEGADHSPINANRAARDAIIATAIGKTTAAIKAELATGKSLGVIAGDKRAALITALVADQSKRIDAAVTAGKMTAAQATTLKAGLTAQVTAEVDALRPAMGPEMGMGGKMGRHGGKN